MGVSGSVVVVYVDNGLIWQFSRGEYSSGISPSAAVDPVAVKAATHATIEVHQFFFRFLNSGA